MSGEFTTPEAAAEALLATAKAGGEGAPLAARRAAALAEVAAPALAREALAIAAALSPLDPAPKLGLARLHAEAGDLAAAAEAAEDVLAHAVDKAAQARAAFILGEIARAEGRAELARARYETTLRIENELMAAAPGEPAAVRWHARARGRLAELDAADGAFERALTGAEGALAMLRAAASHIGESPALAADIADAEMRMAALDLDAGRAASARRRLDEAIARYEALAATEKHEPHWRGVLSDAWMLAAEAELERGAAEPARTAMDRALQARIGLAARDPHERWGLAGVWRRRAALRAELGDLDEAAASLRQARALAEALCAEDPEAEAPARFLAHTLLQQADCALRAEDLVLARDAADDGRLLAEAFAAASGREPLWCADAAACWDRLGEVARRAGATGRASEAFARAVGFRRLAHEADPNLALHTRGLAAALLRQGDAALEAGDAEAARTAFGESASLRLTLMEAAPEDARAAYALAAALERVGLAAHALADRDTARAAWEDELALADFIFAPESLDGLRFRAIVEAHIAGLRGIDSDRHRLSALGRLDALAKAGVLTERETALRLKLWRG